MDWVYLKSDFCAPWIIHKMGLKGKVNKAFLQCLPIFLFVFDDISKWSAPKALLNLVKSSKITKNLCKNEEKPGSSCLQKPISPWDFLPKNPKPTFRVPDSAIIRA